MRIHSQRRYVESNESMIFDAVSVLRGADRVAKVCAIEGTNRRRIVNDEENAQLLRLSQLPTQMVFSFKKILCLTAYRFAFLISTKATPSSPLRISVRSFDTNRVTRHVLLPSRFLSHTHCPFRLTSALMISSTRFFRRAFTSGTVDEETYE